MKTQETIDAHFELIQDSSHRKHLGASVIGKDCARELWYIFRWAKERKHGGRILRLFERGHYEEPRFIDRLRAIGVTVWEHNDNGEQFKASACNGHFGLALDGVALGVPDWPHEPVNLEFKTYNDKRFAQLAIHGVFNTSMQHYAQVQTGMELLDLNATLYQATNKNNDEIHEEIIVRDRDAGKRYIERAGSIIASDSPLPRIHNSPGWYACKFCDFHSVCHTNDKPEVNCRTCAHSTPVENGEWHCGVSDKLIPGDLDRVGCSDHVFIPPLVVDYIPGAEYIEGDHNNGSYHLDDGSTLINGPDGISSEELNND